MQDIYSLCTRLIMSFESTAECCEIYNAEASSGKAHIVERVQTSGLGKSFGKISSTLSNSIELCAIRDGYFVRNDCNALR